MDFSEELANGYKAINAIMTSDEWVSQYGKYPECGTKAGHDAHYRKYKDEACEACCQAMRDYWKAYRKRPETIAKNKDYNRTNRKVRNGSRFRYFSKNYDIQRDFYSANTVINMYGTDCHLCGGAIDLNAPRKAGEPGWEKSLHIDHVSPISKGGHDTLENVRPAHGKCNVKKGNSVSN